MDTIIATTPPPAIDPWLKRHFLKKKNPYKKTTRWQLSKDLSVILLLLDLLTPFVILLNGNEREKLPSPDILFLAASLSTLLFAGIMILKRCSVNWKAKWRWQHRWAFTACLGWWIGFGALWALKYIYLLK